MRTRVLISGLLALAGLGAVELAGCQDDSSQTVKIGNGGANGSGTPTVNSGSGAGMSGSGADGSTTSEGQSTSVSMSGPTGTGGTTSGQGGMSTTSVTSTTSGNGGAPAMCMQPSDCGKNNSCVTWGCNGGKCVANNAPRFAACYKDGGNGASCDGAGTCSIWVLTNANGAPSARYNHTAVWTGSKMIVWGGLTKNGVTNTGFMYDPKTDGWAAISTAGAPTARHSHAAVWTGSKMYVWGGFGSAAPEMVGGFYDPATDKWTAMSTTNQPALRQAHAMEFTGTQILVWGGRNGVTALNSGGRYTVANDSWVAMSAVNAPSARFNFSHGYQVASPKHASGLLFIWGGTDTSSWFGDGAFYQPGSDTWTKVDMSGGAPPNGGAPPTHQLESVTAFRDPNGYGFYLFGGWDGFDFYGGDPCFYWEGAENQPDGYWQNLKPGDPEVASPRARYVGVVPGTGIFIWGGCKGAGCDTLIADGALWKPDGKFGVWKSFPSDTLTARSDSAAVYTGSDVIIWGGYNGNPLGDGARRAVDPNPL